MSMKKEAEEGKIEYKLKLNAQTEERLQKLATQLVYRLGEGGGEAFYELGVSDEGEPLGLTEEEAKESLKIMEQITKTVGASFIIIRKERAKRGYVYELLVRKTVDSPPIQISVALLGNVDAGKSTLKGVLVYGTLDDGDGKAMSLVAKYLHELKFRRSSSVSVHVLGFNEMGESINDSLRTYDEAKIYLEGSKIVTLIDLAGHERYLKTTMRGVLGHLPDYTCMVVGANAGPIGTFREHLGMTVALGIPCFVVVTKVDMAPQEVLERNLEKVIHLLKLPGINKIPFIIRNKNDTAIAARHMPHGRVAPIFLISNVTGQGLQELKAFLNMLPPKIDWHERAKGKLLCYIDEKFDVSGVGLVVAGLVEEGSVKSGDRVLLGPFDDGSFRTVRVKSIEVNRVRVERAEAGQIAAYAITNARYDEIRRGMVLLDLDATPVAVRRFKAHIRVLHHPTTIKIGYEPVIQMKTIRQAAKLVKTTKKFLRSGDTDRVEFSFILRPEYVRKGDVFFFREGRTKGIGTVTEVSSTP
ncbi:MAG TPA: elongation factor 1-alpha [Candidatus Korarchaeota archaeon]|nr:elongation factor 1-alpha [Candidatus Korarchaeota archaeon]